MQPERNAADVAWAAGLFEGEGCFNVFTHKSGKVQIAATLGMTDGDTVERFAAVVGMGTVRKYGRAKAHWKPIYDWRVQEAEKVREIINLFLPYLGERRRAKALEVLEAGKDIQVHHGRKTHCPKGHPYDGDNLVIEWVDTGDARHRARRCLICRREQSRERARKRLGITPDRYRVTD